MARDRVTIQDVAHAAGVSMKSVSRVVNREPNVRPQLREKVQAAIATLGYVPNVAARSLAAGRHFVIGLLFDNPSPNYTMKVQEGAYAACRRNGYQLVIDHIDTAAPDVRRQMEAILKNSRLDAMIVTPPATECEAVLAALEGHGVRYARLSPTSFPGRSSATVMDDRSAAQDVVAHLWDRGHRRFGIVNGPPAHGAAAPRHDGFMRALVQRGVDSADIVQADGDFSFQSGIGAGLALLTALPRPTAIFATNDDMAAGVFAAAAQLGVQIPRDLSIVGFDDSWIASSLWPGLTTIHQPIAEMAQTAVQLLIEGDEIRQVALDYALVERGSTAPVAP